MDRGRRVKSSTHGQEQSCAPVLNLETLGTVECLRGLKGHNLRKSLKQYKEGFISKNFKCFHRKKGGFPGHVELFS